MGLFLPCLAAACVGGTTRAHEPASETMEGPCAAFDREQAPYVTAIREAWPAHPVLSPSFGRCFASSFAGRGAWGISLDHVESAAGHVVGRWSLVHLTKEGRRAAVGLTLPRERTAPPVGDGIATTEGNFDDALTLDTPALFDFDGDGEDEVLIRLANAPGGRERVVAGHLWSFRDGVVSRYTRAPDLDIEALRDVDHDGRPDLETFSPWQAPSRIGSPCAPPVYRVHGRSLLAHALSNGTFSLDDEVAKAVARGSCATAPASFTLASDGVRTVTSLACARLRGASIDEVLRVIDAECVANPDDACVEVPACEDARLWRALARMPPSLRLP